MRRVEVAEDRTDSSVRTTPGTRHLVSGKALAAVAVWGMSFVATRIALEGFHPVGLVGFRFLGGALMLAAITRGSGGSLIPARANLPRCVFIGGVLGLHLLIQAFGLLYTSAINTGWIISFIPVTIALSAQLFLKQRLKRIGWAGVGLATCGVWVVTMSTPAEFTDARFGDLLQLTSCITWTVYTLVGASLVARNGALRVTTFAMMVAAAMGLAATAATGVLTGPMTTRVALAAGFLVLICSGLPYYLWFQGQQDYGPTRVGSLLYFEPFFTLAGATALLHEPLQVNTLVGGLGVLAGVCLVAKGTSR